MHKGVVSRFECYACTANALKNVNHQWAQHWVIFHDDNITTNRKNSFPIVHRYSVSEQWGAYSVARALAPHHNRFA
jgi:hypothetical protein